jgi:hypothetical protein
LKKLAGRRPGYEKAAREAGLDPNDPWLATTYFDLFTQSETAAGRFLDQLGALRDSGITPDALTNLRYHAYVDPATRQRYQGAAGGFAKIARQRLGRAPTEAEIAAVARKDQERRMSALAEALAAQGFTTPPSPPARRPGPNRR